MSNLLIQKVHGVYSNLNGAMNEFGLNCALVYDILDTMSDL